eukprot:362183-Chlamydomonas_euryale.AAC.3
MGWLRTVRNGVPFATAPSPLLDPLCLATLNTCILFVGPLPVNLALTLTQITCKVHVAMKPDGLVAKQLVFLPTGRWD